MSITVAGSIAFDSVKTPFGERERMLGGAATHFALAASFFTDVHVVGPIGTDFGEAELEILGLRGTSLDDVHQVGAGKTFFWAGEYGSDMNSRTTLDTELGVFADFEPELSAESRAADVLFLANIQPDLQRRVLDQCAPRFTAVDSMDLWIETARASLIEVIERVDCLILNDAELRQLTGKPSIVAAAREVLRLGPGAVIAKQGEYGATLVTADGFFSLPAFPLESVVDPTGAGDTFAGGLLGYVAAHAGSPVGHDLLATAMAYGTAAASYNVEAFGTDGIVYVTADEIGARVTELATMTRFQHRLVELRA